MNEHELDAIRARLEVVPDPPWEYDGEIITRPGSALPIAYDYNSDDVGQFIAHAPTDIAALLAEVERLRKGPTVHDVAEFYLDEEQEPE